MIFTARQLEDLHRNTGANGQIVLPYAARLTPNAQDWIRQRKIGVGYSDVDATAVQQAATTNSRTDAAASAPTTPFLWWCDGPCGPAKAALVTQSKESALAESSIAQDQNHLIPAIKHVAAEVKSGRVSGAVLLVQ